MGGTDKRRNKPTEPGLKKETSLKKESDSKETSLILNKETESVMKDNECFLCGAPDATLCKACGVVAACPLHTSHHQVAIFDFFFVLFLVRIQIILLPLNLTSPSSWFLSDSTLIDGLDNFD